MAKALNAHSPDVQDPKQTACLHGVDLILGGHDHLYYISKGVTSWEGYDIHEEVLGAEKDEGDILIVKSGTDFRDLSEITLEVEDTPEGSIRTKVIKSIRGKSCNAVSDFLLTFLGRCATLHEARIEAQ